MAPPVNSKGRWLAGTFVFPLFGIIWWLSAGRVAPPLCSTAVVGMLLAVLVFSSWTDWQRGKVYNFVTYPAFLELVLFNAIWSTGLIGACRWAGAVGVEYALLGAVACFGIALIPYIFSCGGAGDAKLAAVIGAALGVELGVASVLSGVFLTGIGVIVSIIWSRGPWFFVRMNFRAVGHWFVPLWISAPVEEEKEEFRKTVPLAPGLFVGTVFVLSGQLERFLAWF